MKKALLIVLLFVPFIGFSQTKAPAMPPITGFLGVKFGSSKAVVLAALRAKGGRLDKANSDAQSLVFSGLKMGLRPIGAVLVKFVHDKAFEADYTFTPDVEAKVIPDYHEIVTTITDKYGPGSVTAKYNYPYVENDDNTLLGLSAGKIDFNTTWSDSNNNAIQVSISTDMTVDVVYQNSALFDEASAAQTAKQKGDL